MKENKIHWEISEVGKKCDDYSREVYLHGVDENGKKYTANAVVSVGEIDDITDIEEVEPYRITSSEFIGDNTYKISFNKSLEHTCRFKDIEDGLNNSINNF